MKLDRRGSEVLSEDACLHRLTNAAAATGTGRIAINGAQSPYVIPVNFTMVEGGIVIRLGPGFAAYHLDGVAVTFEADEVAATLHSGWSVVVEGVARLLTYDEVARLGKNLPTPIVTEPGVRVFEISPIKVTGRAIESDLRDEQSDRVAGSPEQAESPAQADEPPNDLHLGSDAAEELASVLHWVLGEEIADADNATVRRNLVERHRLLEDIAAQLTQSGDT